MKLEGIPTEIVLNGVAKYLRPEEKAALALTSKTMRSKLDADVFNLPTPVARYNLLLHLFEDGMFFPKILCHWCRKFHNPAPNDSWKWADSNPSQQRPCQAFGANRDNHEEASVVLPGKLHYNLVKAIMHFYHRGIRHRYTPDWLDYDTQTIVTDDGHKLKTRYRYSIIHSNLFLKTEKLVYLGKRQSVPAILESISEITKTIRAGTGVEYYRKQNSICCHKKWVHEYPDIFDEDPADQHEENSDYKYPVPPQVTPLVRLARWAGGPLGERASNELTQYPILGNRCNDCYTDFSAAFVRMPDIVGMTGRRVDVCVLTTWKDLGTGLTVTDNKWQSHLTRTRNYHPKHELRGKSKRNDEFEAWEGSLPGGIRDYKPRIGQLVLLDLAD